MNKLLASTAIAALFVTFPAMAQDQPPPDQGTHRHDQGLGPQGSRGSTGQGTTQNSSQTGSNSNSNGSSSGGSMSGSGSDDQSHVGDSNEQGGKDHDHGTRDHDQGVSGATTDHGMVGGTKDHDHSSQDRTLQTHQPPAGWHGYDQNHMQAGAAGRTHFDVHTYQRNITSSHHFHAGAYHPPQGWYQHRWHFGELLPRAFFIRDYWIDDFWDFGLLQPPPGLVWVRVGDDALLVDEDTGEVVEVVYDVFY